MSDLIIWIVLIFVFLIIIGLYISEFTPMNLNEKEKILKLNYLTENFTPEISSTNEQSEGASELYHWGLPDNTVYHPENKPKKCEHKCNDKCPKECPMICPTPPPPPPPPPPIPQCREEPKKSSNESCSTCDITKNKDIDKYVLKSSVPPCPDMSEFITKNMMNANPDLSDYILKSEVKPCDKVDYSQYILKSQIPPCPTCPLCPECPLCPVCPPQQKCKEIYEYNIGEHPDLSNYISKAELADKYIAKDQILNSPIVQDYLNKNCKKDDKSPQQSAQIPQPSPQVNNTPPQPIQNNSNNSSLLEDDVMGYYAGDSLFAGV
jgi:hypothetical protein